jgi:hypothetical protein
MGQTPSFPLPAPELAPASSSECFVLKHLWCYSTMVRGSWIGVFARHVGLEAKEIEGMRPMRFALQLAVFLTLAFSVSAATPAWVELAQLTASDGHKFDGLGNSVSISGDTIVAGSPGAGAAYVFVKPQSGWTNMTQVAKLTASDGQLQDFFGGSVSISQNTIVVGAACASVNGNSCQGAAYVFVKPVSGWSDMTETAKLTTSDGQAGDEVASSTSISGNTIALGAPLKTVNGISRAGEVYVYQKPSSGWANTTETAKFTASGNNHGQDISFGESVALGGGTLTVGAPGYYVGFHNYGVIFVFLKAAGGWKHTTSFTTRLQSSKNSLSDLGTAVVISSDGRTVVGGTNLSPNPGRVLIFVKPANGWPNGQMTEAATLTDGTGTQDEFGSAVGISGNTVIVGAWNPRKLGAAYVFAKPANGWKTTHKHQAKLMASGEDASWNFGGLVTIGGSTAVVSANGWSNGQGAAFVFGK